MNSRTGFRGVGRLLLLLALMLAPGVGACAEAGPWTDFKGRFVLADGRVVDTGNRNISHSEGQGFAMVMATAYNDREAFDRIWSWTDRVLSRPDMRLFSWRYDPSAAQPVADPNNATDGDLMIAWALQRAAQRWKEPRYAQQSAAIRAAILERLVVRQGSRTLLTPGLTGFVHPDSVVVNPSYAVLPALDAFAALEPRGPWPKVRDESLKLVRDARFGAHFLPSDWVRVDTAGGLWTDPANPPRFGFDAVRVPLYLAWSGRSRDLAMAGPRQWWRSARRPAQRAPAWIDVRTGETAPFAASVGMDSVAQLTLTGQAPAAGLRGEDYYSAALLALVDVAARESRHGRARS
ncbi:glycosyl hydrolase family 8 [Phenylobacterium sp.]|uniref:glycosyl hydrolase family 8 n=1 Tax=Phenylobacterium sp. TaxID=1871053 RepID=UPI0035AF5800